MLADAETEAQWSAASRCQDRRSKLKTFRGKYGQVLRGTKRRKHETITSTNSVELPGPITNGSIYLSLLGSAD